MLPRRLAAFLMIGSLAALALSTQSGELQGQAPASATAQSDARAKISVNSNLVILPVTVKNRFGDLVADLQQDDFRVFDENVEQNISVFTAEAFPLSLVILVDDDLKSKDAEHVAPSLRAIAGGISANDEVMVCRFDLSFYPGDAFTSDLDQLWAALKDAQSRSGPSTAGPVPFITPPTTHSEGVGESKKQVAVKAGPRPTKALDDAIYSSADLLHDRGATRRKMILVISDGVNGAPFNKHTYAETIESLLRDNVSVFSVAVGNSLIKHKFARLTDYANDTGGDIYFASDTRAMERLYSQITEEARHEYTLAYIPNDVSQSRSPYHKVEVRVAREAVTVKTRQGYYAPEPKSR
jgi:Ca-activated chloride channel family protein